MKSKQGGGFVPPPHLFLRVFTLCLLIGLLPGSDAAIGHARQGEQLANTSASSLPIGYSEFTSDSEEGEQEESVPEDNASDENPEETPSPVAYTFQQFQKLAQDSVTTTIYLGADIVMEGPVRVNEAKPYLVIDGIDPGDETGVIHTWTDYPSDLQDYTVYLRYHGALKQVTLRNLNVKGKNHYGFFSVYDACKDISIFYQNVTYSGPQMTFNRYGTSHYHDVTANIGRFGGSSAPGEVGEVSHVILEGQVHLEQMNDYQENEFFYFATQEGKLTLSQGAQVTVVTPFNAGFVHLGADVQMELLEGSVLRYQGRNRFWEGRPLTQVTLHTGAELHIEIDSAVNGLLRVSGPLLVGEDSVLRIINKGTAAYPPLVLGAAGARFEGPRRVVLYSSNSRNLYYEPAGSLWIEAPQVNYWSTAGGSGFQNPPVSRWWKSTDERFEIEGRVSSGAAGNFTAITSNYDENDTPSPEAPNAQNFHMQAARTLSFGYLPLYAENQGGNIAGLTEPGASIQLRYTDESGNPVLLNILADEDGRFWVPLSPSPPDSATVQVQSCSDYLFAETSVTVGAGEVSFAKIPSELSFPTTPIPSEPAYIARADPDWGIAVSDQLYTGEEWELSVQLVDPLTAVTERGVSILPQALVFVDGSGVHPLSSSRQTVVHRQVSSGSAELVDITWPADSGLMVLATPGETYADSQYTATLRWILEIVP